MTKNEKKKTTGNAIDGEEIVSALNSMTNEINKIAGHICKKQPQKWYHSLSFKDITILVGLLAFIFTAFQFRETYTKFQQRNRMVESIANTALRLSQDLAFRPSGADIKEKVIDDLLSDARKLSPQDPDLLAVQIYSQFMRKAREPSKEDLMLMDAYLNYVNRLRKIENARSFLSKAIEFRNEQIITLGRFLQKLYYVGASAVLQYLETTKVDDSSRSLLLNKSAEYISTGITICQEEEDLIYEALLLTLKVQYGFIMIKEGEEYDEEIEASLNRAQAIFSDFKRDKKSEIQLTGYDGAASICYLRGRYFIEKGNKRKAIAELKKALNGYEEVANKFKGKINTVEVNRVKALLSKLSSSK